MGSRRVVVSPTGSPTPGSHPHHTTTPTHVAPVPTACPIPLAPVVWGPAQGPGSPVAPALGPTWAYGDPNATGSDNLSTLSEMDWTVLIWTTIVRGAQALNSWFEFVMPSRYLLYEYRNGR